MSLCDVCLNVDIRSLLAAAYERSKDSKDYIGAEPLSDDIVPYKHYGKISDVERSAEQCEFCERIWAKEGRRTKDEDPDDWVPTDAPVFLYVLGHRYGKRKRGVLGFRLHVRVADKKPRSADHMFRSFSTGEGNNK